MSLPQFFFISCTLPHSLFYNNVMNSRRWLHIFLTISVLLCALVTGLVLWVDPFFQYHKPHTDSLQYTMGFNYQRYYNAGILKNFDYDSLIIGTSLTEFYKTSETEQIFGGTFIKVPFSGATWAEINDNILLAEKNHELKTVIRPLDFRTFGIMDSDYKNNAYPTYLYDDNRFNDVRYIFNLETIYMCARTVADTLRGHTTGITSFDDYCNWDSVEFSKKRALAEITEFREPDGDNHLSEEETEQLRQNIQENVLKTAQLYPETTFYYYIPPYSIASWGLCRGANDLSKRFEAEELLISMSLEQENIRLFSFATHTEWTTDLNNYCDIVHYSPKMNTLILQEMKEGTSQLTRENWKSYLEAEKEFYSSYPYNGLIGD